MSPSRSKELSLYPGPTRAKAESEPRVTNDVIADTEPRTLALELVCLGLSLDLPNLQQVTLSKFLDFCIDFSPAKQIDQCGLMGL